MNTTLKLALGAVALAAAHFAAAAPVNFSGSLSSSDPTYNRVLAGTPPTALSLIGTAVRYDTYQFFVDLAGSYRMETLFAAFNDTFLTLYLGASFNAATPLVNALSANDDIGTGNLLSRINLNLLANTNYLLVATSFNNADRGAYNGIIAANTGNAGNVFTGTVSMPVPAPATLALVPLALAALALTRRRRPAELAA